MQISKFQDERINTLQQRKNGSNINGSPCIELVLLIIFLLNNPELVWFGFLGKVPIELHFSIIIVDCKLNLSFQLNFM